MKDLLPLVRDPNRPVDNHVIKFNSDDQRVLPKFMSQNEVAESNISKLNENITEIKKIQKIILASPTKNDEQQKQLNDLNDEIKTLSTSTRNILQALQTLMKENQNSQNYPADYQIMKNTHYRSVQNFTGCMKEYNELQESFKKNCMQRIQRSLEIRGVPKSEEEVEKMIEDGQITVFASDVSATEVARQQFNEIEARHNDIINLEKSIVELANIFRDMSAMIEAQGEIINIIDKNTADAVEYVKKAETEMNKAQVYQSRSRRMKFIIALVVIIIIVIVGLSVGLKLR